MDEHIDLPTEEDLAYLAEQEAYYSAPKGFDSFDEFNDYCDAMEEDCE